MTTKQTLSGAWQFRQANTEEWLPATVPGGVHTDLLALERIPDPFVGDNEKHVAWVAESDWEYRYTFDTDSALLAQPQVWLVCDGLDTLATVTLNGEKLGETNNMYRQYRWDVKSLLKNGDNELQIAFASPVQFVTAQEAERPMKGVSQAIAGGPHLRKAPSQFGWDWGPQLPPIGIWKDIRLEGYANARLDDVHLSQQHADGKVTVSAQVNAECWSDAPRTATLTVVAPDGTVFDKSAALSPDNGSKLEVKIVSPQLWYPNGYGEQPLYQVSVELYQDATLLDEKKYQLGLRTLELKQEPDEWGKSFVFVVNGVEIWAKGSNWIPADSLPTRISDELLAKLLGDAAAAHHNMIRVWGGGFYEEERFYDLCDKLGILVWQDFIFSCSIYPLDEKTFRKNVKAEVIENVRRLRHRASLALWCGNNEMEWGWESWGWAEHPLEKKLPKLVKKFPALGFLLAQVGERKLLADWKELQAAYKKFFYRTLPKWVGKLDPDTPYWTSSPSSDIPFEDVNGQKQGDAHYWDVWHGRKPFTAYRDQFPRFMSEFGFQALPPLATIKTFADEADWNMTSYIMEQHQKNDSGNSLMVGQMLDTFRLPKDFDALVYLSMVLQAEGIRYGVEHWRRFPERVAGTLYWQLNDCWPVASWSSLDYFGRWKALHYASRRFYAPLLLSIEDKPPQQDIYITNETLEDFNGMLHWTLETLAGEVLLSGEETVHAQPQSAALISALDFSEQVTDNTARELVFVAELFDGDHLLSRQTAYFTPTKHLSLSDPQISSKLSVDSDELKIELSAKSLARLVELSFNDTDVIFSDNYFDLPAGRPVTITCPIPAGWDVPQAEDALRVRSVYNSFA
ncbi:MAG: glycoside hydrolase family 2 protein [Anaerolineae bacterium]|nr:glycoside hydrolase family 2 protein [Anaerolineae bacterium]MBT7070541.1 glycoside hydrolase family 2 protein [Anaerolineae bacterium]MBT7326889.1 glycoside hydrolase family 2 protein [Anaerolineae bacterium]